MYSKAWWWYSGAAVVLLVFGLVLTYQKTGDQTSASMGRALSQDESAASERRQEEMYALMDKLQRALDDDRMRDISSQDIDRFSDFGLDARQAISLLYEFTEPGKAGSRQRQAALHVLKGILTKDDTATKKLIFRGLGIKHLNALDLGPDFVEEDILQCQYFVLVIFGHELRGLTPDQRHILFLYSVFRHWVLSTDVISEYLLVGPASPEFRAIGLEMGAAHMDHFIKMQNPHMDDKSIRKVDFHFTTLFNTPSFTRFAAAFKAWKSGSTGKRGTGQSKEAYAAEAQRIYRYLFDRECGTESNFREKLFSE